MNGKQRNYITGREAHFKTSNYRDEYIWFAIMTIETKTFKQIPTISIVPTLLPLAGVKTLVQVKELWWKKRILFGGRCGSCWRGSQGPAAAIAAGSRHEVAKLVVRVASWQRRRRLLLRWLWHHLLLLLLLLLSKHLVPLRRESRALAVGLVWIHELLEEEGIVTVLRAFQRSSSCNV